MSTRLSRRVIDLEKRLLDDREYLHSLLAYTHDTFGDAVSKLIGSRSCGWVRASNVWC
jgi:hypothetical protein